MKLTEKAIQALQPTGKLVWYPDSGPWPAVTGLYLLVTPGGKKSFVCRYRLDGTRQRRTISIGTFPGMGLDGARKKAKEITRGASKDLDPLALREARRNVSSFSKWVETYMKDAEKRKRPASVREDGRYTAIAIAAWGTRSVDSISSDDVRSLHRRVGDKTPIQADRWLASIRKLFAVAVERRLLLVNPAAGIKKLTRYEPRHRVLSETEIKALSATLRAEDISTQVAFLLMLGAGLRSSEARTIQWTDVNKTTKTLTLPATKSGRAQAVPLSPEVLALIDRLPKRLGSPYLFPGLDPLKPRADWKKSWQRVLNGAGLDKAGLTLHDLRRTAGYLATKSAGIAVASRLLRHSSLNLTSAIYAPLIAEDARPAVVQLAKVISLKRRKRTA
jgi:integrase